MAVSTAEFLTIFLLKTFLSNEMMYSCALWSDEEGGVRGDLTLAGKPGDLGAAQLRKIYYVLRKARIRPGDRILEFGSGWGALAIEVSYSNHHLIYLCQTTCTQAARHFSCEVDTLTLSVEQKILADKRIRKAGLEGRVRVHLLDYRSIPPEFEKAFDAFISIEMLEVRPDYCLFSLAAYKYYLARRPQGMITIFFVL